MTRKFTLIVVFVITLLAAARGAGIDKSMKVPVLTVDLSEASGECLFIDFSLSRKPTKSPLTVAIAEDTPGGAGESVRASVWLAAMVAAVDRLDNLSGVRISLDIPGQVDGPSAGGVICLAFMSALDGRDWPKDCMMTGMIMPDGSIGEVGGMVQKLQAASKAGAKRVLVPAQVRFEKDLKTGTEIDLKRLAADLKLEFVLVENIGEAYAAAHKLAPPAAKHPPRDVLELPAATEEWLKRKYKLDLEMSEKVWDAIPKEQKEQIALDLLGKSLLVQTRVKAERAFRGGRLLYAQQQISSYRAALEARSKNEEVFAALKTDTLEDRLKGIDKKRQQLINDLPDPWKTLVVSSKELPEVGVQFCGGYYEIYDSPAMDLILQASVDELVTKMKSLDAKDEEKRGDLSAQLINVKVTQLWLAHLIQIATAEAPEAAKGIAGTLPNSTIRGEEGSAERLFFSAYLAAQNTLLKDVVKVAAKEIGVTEDTAIAAMCQHDSTMACYQYSAAAGQELHRALAELKEDKLKRFTRAAAAHVHVTNLATASALIMRWSILDLSLDDQDEMSYGRTDLLNHLLNTARETALANIAACKSRGLTCIQAISDFEDAEMGRDDKDNDKVTVLANYWKASLEAKALMMLMQPSK